jgi:hypothetical protein
MRLGLGPSSWSVPGSVPARTTSRPCPPRRKEASEIAFPLRALEQILRTDHFRFRRLHRTSYTAWSIKYARYFTFFSLSANGTRAIPRRLDICVYNLAKENSTFYLQLCIVDTEDMVSRCLKPRTYCRASVQPSVRAKVSVCRPWLR